MYVPTLTQSVPFDHTQIVHIIVTSSKPKAHSLCCVLFLVLIVTHIRGNYRSNCTHTRYFIYNILPSFITYTLIIRKSTFFRLEFAQ